MSLKELQKLGQEYDSALSYKESPFYRPFLCSLMRHKTKIISMRTVRGEERCLTLATIDYRFKCQCGREYYQYGYE